MKKNKLSKILPIAVMMLIGGAVGFFGASVGMDAAKAMPKAQVITLLVLIVPSYYLVVAFHEAGHALAGTLVKFDFRMYVVGPFMWDREESGWKFKWNKNLNLSGGLVICLPSSSDNMAKRFSMYALGGPAASLVLAAIAYTAKHLVSPSDQPIDALGWFFGMVSFLSLVIFVITIVPLHMGGFYTDGARALRFLRGGETSRFEVLLMKQISESSAGVRPRHYNLTDLQEAVQLAEKTGSKMKMYLHYYLYQHAFDQGQHDEAEKELQAYMAYIENIPEGMRGSVYLEATFFYAYAHKDLAKAETFFKQYKPSAIISKAQLHSVEAVLGFLKGDKKNFETKLALTLKEIPNMIDRGTALALKDKMESLAGESVPQAQDLTLNAIG